MTDRAGTGEELTAAARAAVDLWLRGSGVLAVQPGEAPTTPVLAHYLCGALSVVEAHEVERGLVAHPEARAQLGTTCDILDTMPQRNWAEVVDLARGEGPAAEVARVWLLLVTAQASGAASARRAWLGLGWDGIRADVAGGIREARTAWAAFLTFGEQLRVALRTPRLAVVKGLSGEEPIPVLDGELPGGLTSRVASAEVEGDGTLRVRLQLVDPSGQPSEAASGALVDLAFLVNGEAWPLAGAVVDGSELSWSLSELGSQLGLPTGSLPAASLALLATRTLTSPPPADGTLLAPVRDSEGGETGAPPVALTIHGEPGWHGGQFTVSIAIPRAARLAYPNHSLVLELPIAADLAQRLGEWPLRDWGDDPRLLTTPCPGSEEATAPAASMLRAYLRPPTPE